ncbi:neurofilament medium polypeptide protein [Stemphylium lycopersici]|nr:neurofilament medium polypeptide protein [Stemphylium lycopersici]RAR09753.1 neurofilament medium polypeptide protein [Stemphylium lycopersici]
MKFTSTLFVLSVATLTNARALYTRQNNAQTFTGALGGVAATPILDSGIADRPFSVKGDTFVNLSGALQRSCDQQFNGCANLANSGNGNFSTQECQVQKEFPTPCASRRAYSNDTPEKNNSDCEDRSQNPEEQTGNNSTELDRAKGEDA